MHFAPSRGDVAAWLSLLSFLAGAIGGCAPTPMATPADSGSGVTGASIDTPNPPNNQRTENRPDPGIPADDSVGFGVVSPINRAPIAYEQSLVIAYGQPTPLTLRGADTDGPQPLTYEIIQQPVHGVLSGEPPALLYTPNAGFFGIDQVWFIVFDGKDESAVADILITVDDPYPSLATNPSPPDGLTDLDFDITLMWRPARKADRYRVYFGDSPDLTEQDLLAHTTDESATVTNLAPGRLYYWRVDGVNESGVTMGDLWRFMTR